MIPPEIVFTIPDNASSGDIRQPNGDPSGNATFARPSYPTAPAPFLCNLPCIGNVYVVPIPAHERWVCSVERITHTRVEGINNGDYFNWRPGYKETVTVTETTLELPLKLFLPGDIKKGSHFWNISPTPEIPLMSVDGFSTPAIPPTGYFHKDSLGLQITPCDAPPYATDESWSTRWQDIYAKWRSQAGKMGWIENFYFEWRFSEIGDIIPRSISLLPIYSGTLSMMAALMGGNGGGGGLGMMSWAFVASVLQGVYSSSASSGGRIMKNAEDQEMTGSL